AADLAIDAGDLPAAGRWVAAHARWLDWNGAVLWQPDQHLLRARHAGATGDPAAARAHAETALAHATEPRRPLALLAAHRLLRALDPRANRLTDARAHLDAALALAEACAAPYERALTLLALAELHTVAGKWDRAAAPLDEARGLLEPLAARHALARAAAVE